MTPLKILFVDNHPLFLEFGIDLLEEEGHIVKGAPNGLEAIDILRDFIPDVLFTDLVMPYIDGARLCEFIRTKPELDETFIVVISGIAMEADQRFRPPQANAYLAKGPFPQLKKSLLQLLEDYLDSRVEHYSQDVIGIEGLGNRHVTKELLFSLKHLQVVLKNMSEGIVEITQGDRIVSVNPKAASFLQKKETALLGQPFSQVFPRPLQEKVNAILMSGGNQLEEKERVVQVGDKVIQLDIFRVEEGDKRSRLILFRDITHFRRALEEKEMLIREIHHRVKNNLSMISGIIHLESSQVNNEKAESILKDINHRIQSISLIHTQLYQTNRIGALPFGEYVESLVDALIDLSYKGDREIRRIIEIPSLFLPLRIQFPLGLILNELVVNAIKYGLTKTPEHQEVILKIVMTEEGENLHLLVSNSGPKFQGNLSGSTGNGSGVGLDLVQILAEQIKGNFLLKQDSLTTFSLSFPAP